MGEKGGKRERVGRKKEGAPLLCIGKKEGCQSSRSAWKESSRAREKNWGNHCRTEIEAERRGGGETCLRRRRSKRKGVIVRRKDEKRGGGDRSKVRESGMQGEGRGRPSKRRTCKGREGNQSDLLTAEESPRKKTGTLERR